MIVTALAQLVSEPITHGLIQIGQSVTAAAPTPEPTSPNINTDGVVAFIATKITPILLAVLGVIFISRAGKGEMSKVLTSSAIAIVGLAFIAGAGALFFFGEGLINLIFE
ncbi:MAG TPA: hypothetical protein VF163_18285 [Micromonosporaceae bacterium]